MAVTPKGVRLVNESIVQEGRGLVVTDRSAVEWNKIPDGSLYINPVTGIMMTKLAGESDWVPAGIKNDGTLVISKDTSMHVETFKIISINEENHTFVYEDGEGHRQTKTKDDKGFVFQIVGEYIPHRNHLVVVFDDVLERSEASGGIKELDEHRFRVTEDIPVGTELTVKYIQWVRIGNPYPRWYEAYDEPTDAEVGDFFLDFDNNEEAIDDDELENYNVEVRWTDIADKPNTVSGFGIRDASLVGHTHNTSEINGLENLIQQKINGIDNIDANTLQSLQPDKTCQGGANKIAVYNASGKLPASVIPTNAMFQVGMIIDWYGTSSAAPTGWAICDGRTQNGIKTPDLRGKFIIGGGTSGTYIGSTRSNNSAAPVKSGGAASVALAKANLPPHDHKHTHKHKHSRGTMNITGYIRGENETYSAGGAFVCSGSGNANQSEKNYGNKNDINFDASRNWTGYTSEDATANSASTNSSEFKSTAFNIIPPYVALFKIMYVGV